MSDNAVFGGFTDISELRLDRTRSVAFSGHRTPGLPEGDGLYALGENISIAVGAALKHGCDTFINGGCYGFDLMCADYLLALREGGYALTLVTAAPFPGQEKGWEEADKELYYRVLEGSDYVVKLADAYSPGAYMARNRFMVDNCSLLIAYCSGGGGTRNTVEYAERTGVPVINLAMPD